MNENDDPMGPRNLQIYPKTTKVDHSQPVLGLVGVAAVRGADAAGLRK